MEIPRHDIIQQRLREQMPWDLELKETLIRERIEREEIEEADKLHKHLRNEFNRFKHNYFNFILHGIREEDDLITQLEEIKLDNTASKKKTIQKVIYDHGHMTYCRYSK